MAGKKKNKVQSGERIGKIDFTISACDTREARTSPEERAKALTTWLLAQWKREQAEKGK